MEESHSVTHQGAWMDFFNVMNEEIVPMHHHKSHNLFKDAEYNMSKRDVSLEQSRTWPWESLLRAIFMNPSLQKSI